VFGSSEPAPGSGSYELARQVGALLARAGLDVITGGYGGVMEGASRGAVETGGSAVGVTTRALAAVRVAPNPYLTKRVDTEDLFDRTRELISRSAGYIILPGKAGTLAELAFLWALDRAGLLGNRPLILLGSSWRRLLDQVGALGILDRSQLEITQLAETPEEAVEMIRSRLK